MMVNQLNNNSAPWPSTIPQQMPWMSSHQASLPSMQFGQPVADPSQPTTIINPTSHTYNVITTPSSAAPLSFQQPMIPDIPCTSINPPNPNNPFDPSVAAQNNMVPPINQPLMGMQYPISMRTSNPQQYAANSQPSCYQSLTHMTSNHYQTSLNQPLPHKRNSIEMEDEQIKEGEPPTKQQLSENRLLNRFGSLHLDGETGPDCYNDEHQDSSSSDDEETTSTRYNKGVAGRKEFSRYVYLLFREKKSVNPFNRASNGALDRLMRDERDKLSKAVILWSPPLVNSFEGSSTIESDDEEDFNYSDHRDFLKKPSDDSIIITEITDDEPCVTQALGSSPIATDDKMVEE